MYVLRVAAAVLLVAAQLIGMSSPAAADSPCVNGLPVDHTYAYGHWFTGGYQNHGFAIVGTRGNLRVYNPFVADTPPPYTGGVSAWVMLENDTAYAQIGWMKFPYSPDKFNPLTVVQYTTSSGASYPIEFYGSALFPPFVYTYEVDYVTSGGYFQLRKNGAVVTSTPSDPWTPLNHDASVEVFNYTGDQLAGDRTAHMTFRSVGWSDNGVNWYGSTFGTPASSYFAGRPSPITNPDRGAAGYDALTYTDGSNFDTWDARCP